MVWMDEGEEMQVKETAFLQKTAFVIGVVFACLIVIQHRYVFMCYDDYDMQVSHTGGQIIRREWIILLKMYCNSCGGTI